jgi:protein-tyrosine phosphatase
MIDIHCHILPGVDDGPIEMADSVEMCRMAAADGIKKIVATPHFKPGIYELPTSELVTSRASALNDAVKAAGLGVEILVGSEVRLTEAVFEHVGRVDFLTLNRTGAYMLVEFPMSGALPLNWLELLEKLLARGITPVIAHPERSDALIDDPALVSEAVSLGALTQLTAGSLVGEYGGRIRDFSIAFVSDGLAHALSTDSHSPIRRPPCLSEAARAAARVVGESAALDLVLHNPEAIINGRPLP